MSFRASPATPARQTAPPRERAPAQSAKSASPGVPEPGGVRAAVRGPGAALARPWRAQSMRRKVARSVRRMNRRRCIPQPARPGPRGPRRASMARPAGRGHCAARCPPSGHFHRRDRPRANDQHPRPNEGRRPQVDVARYLSPARARIRARHQGGLARPSPRPRRRARRSHIAGGGGMRKISAHRTLRRPTAAPPRLQVAGGAMRKRRNKAGDFGLGWVRPGSGRLRRGCRRADTKVCHCGKLRQGGDRGRDRAPKAVKSRKSPPSGPLIGVTAPR